MWYNFTIRWKSLLWTTKWAWSLQVCSIILVMLNDRFVCYVRIQLYMNALKKHYINSLLLIRGFNRILDSIQLSVEEYREALYDMIFEKKMNTRRIQHGRTNSASKSNGSASSGSAHKRHHHHNHHHSAGPETSMNNKHQQNQNQTHNSRQTKQQLQGNQQQQASPLERSVSIGIRNKWKTTPPSQQQPSTSNGSFILLQSNEGGVGNIGMTMPLTRQGQHSNAPTMATPSTTGTMVRRCSISPTTSNSSLQHQTSGSSAVTTSTGLLKHNYVILKQN